MQLQLATGYLDLMPAFKPAPDILRDELLIALVAIAGKLLEYVTRKAVQRSESWRIFESLVIVVAVAKQTLSSIHRRRVLPFACL